MSAGAVALLRELVAIPSVSGDEAACRDHLLAWFGARGVPAQAHGRNVVVTIEGGGRAQTEPGAPRGSRPSWGPAQGFAEGEARRKPVEGGPGDRPARGPAAEAPAPQLRGLLLCSHYDVVPVGPGWTREPWDAAMSDGRVWGRGSNDAKSSV
ncbi:MAG TPA: M20/M25/M40 family metallo-hydrolase, partial [Planctomycetota bacterium]|nr:M20/M25/M40 family metallo-hydrolase [Planctomycetota bacterium]